MYDTDGNYINPVIADKKDAMLLAMHTYMRSSGLPIEEVIETVATFVYQLSKQTESSELAQKLDEASTTLDEAYYQVFGV